MIALQKVVQLAVVIAGDVGSRVMVVAHLVYNAGIGIGQSPFQGAKELEFPGRTTVSIL